jgi:hypothetical protein
MTVETPKLLTKFRISEDNLTNHQSINDAYREYIGKRSEFGEARKRLREATNKLHALLDAPLRSEGLVPDGKEWTLKEDEDDGLFVFVWAESTRQRTDVPLRRLSIATGDGEKGMAETPQKSSADHRPTPLLLRRRIVR